MSGSPPTDVENSHNGFQPKENGAEQTYLDDEKKPGNRMDEKSEKGSDRESVSDCRRALPPWRGVYTVVACFLVQLSLGVEYSFGNLLPYLTSYVRNATSDTSLDYSRSLWISTTARLVFAGSLLFLRLLQRCIPNRVFLLIGVCTFGVSLLGTSWAMRQSFPLVVVFYGGFQGVAETILYPGCINIPLQWFPNRRGLVGGLVVGGYGGGAFVWNQIVTAWINPHNLQPDQRVGEDLYFTQPEVLDRVPSCFLLIGGVIAGIQLLCVLTVAYPPETHNREDLELVVEGKSASGDADVGANRNISAEDFPMETILEVPDSEELDGISEKLNDPRLDSSSTSSDKEKADKERVEYTLGMTVRTRAAWTMWLFTLLFEVGFTFVFNFYKTYGQTFIADDHLLMLTGSVASVFNAIARPIWGFMADRFGYQPCLMTCQVIMTCASGTFLACEYVGAGMFFVWVCLLYFAIGGIWGLFPSIICSLFGGKNFLSNTSFFITTGLISALVAVFVAEPVKDLLGWHGLFLVGAGCFFAAILLNASLLVGFGCPIPQHMKDQLFTR